MKKRNAGLSKAIGFVVCAAILMSFCFLGMQQAPARAAELVMPTLSVPGYGIVPVMPRSDVAGFNGIAFDTQGNLYAGVVQASQMYKVDKNTGECTLYIPAPLGGADDIIFEPGGRIIWNAFFLGKVFAKGADGMIVTLAEGAPGVNGIARGKDGRVFFTQCYMADAVWELDLSGKMKNRKIAEKVGGPNAMQVGDDGMLYIPLVFKGQVIKMDPATGKYTLVADGFKVPQAVKFGPNGNLYVLDSKSGELVEVDVKTGIKKLVTMVRPHGDNLAFDPQGRLFVSINGDSSILEVDVNTGKIRPVVDGRLAAPQGIAVWDGPQGEVLFLADEFAYKRVDAFTGEIKASVKGGSFCNSSSAYKDKVIMTGWLRNQVEVFDAKNDDMLYSLGKFKAPFGTLMLPDGSILVAEGVTGDLIKVLDKEGKERQVVTKGLESPVYIAPAGPDAVYVTEFLGNRLTKVDLKTGEKKVVCSALRGPKGIAEMPDGTLLVVNTGTKEVVKVDPKTGAVTPFLQNLGVTQYVPQGFLPAYSLSGICIAKSGNIYVTSDLDMVVYKIFPVK